MQLTRAIIEKHIDTNEWLGEFETLLAEIEANIEFEPDISIESCKSLLESIAKNILIRLDVSHSVRETNKKDVQVLLKDAKERLLQLTSESEDVFLTRYVSVVHGIAELRNERGDVSHGRHLPKKSRSSVPLAKSIKAFTDGFASYLLYLLFSIDLSYQEPIRYEDYPDFNNSLDETYPLEVISYSKALYHQDFVAYQEALENYKAEQTLDEELNDPTI